MSFLFEIERRIEEQRTSRSGARIVTIEAQYIREFFREYERQVREHGLPLTFLCVTSVYHQTPLQFYVQGLRNTFLFAPARGNMSLHYNTVEGTEYFPKIDGKLDIMAREEGRDPHDFLISPKEALEFLMNHFNQMPSIAPKRGARHPQERNQ